MHGRDDWRLAGEVSAGVHNTHDTGKQPISGVALVTVATRQRLRECRKASSLVSSLRCTTKVVKNNAEHRAGVGGRECICGLSGLIFLSQPMRAGGWSKVSHGGTKHRKQRHLQAEAAAALTAGNRGDVQEVER